MNKRRLTLQGTIDGGSIEATEHDLTAAGNGSFVTEVTLAFLGALGEAKGVGFGANVRVFNSDVVTHFVTFGVAAMLAPTGPTDGIPVPAGQYLTVNSADLGGYIMSDSALVFGYRLIRDSQFLIIPDTNS